MSTTRRPTVGVYAPRQRPDETDAEFEERISRDVGGRFTEGGDQNGGGAPPRAPGEPGLGTTGPSAVGLVQLLRLLGADVADTTAIGPEAVAALVALQRELGVEGEMGFLGPKTRTAFRAALGGDATPVSAADRAETQRVEREAAADARRDQRDADADARRDRLDTERAERTARLDAERAERTARLDAQRVARQAKLDADRSARQARTDTERANRTPKPRKGRRKKKPQLSGNARAAAARDRSRLSPRAVEGPTRRPTPRSRPMKDPPKSGILGNMEHKKAMTGPVEVLDERQGIVQAIVSVTGVEDTVADVIEPGAYGKTLKTRTPKGVDAHSWERPVAKALDVRELMPGDPGLPLVAPNGQPWPAEAGALQVTAQFNLKTQAGRDAYENVVFFGDQGEWSVGYQVPKGKSTIKNGKRYIKEMDLFEFSPVLFGAMPMARTVSAKSGHPETKTGDVEGSYEWVQCLVRDALHRALGDDPTGFWVEATFPTHVIVEFGSEHARVGYTIRDGVVTFGDVEPVTVSTVVESHLTGADRALMDELRTFAS